jgi:hypothetical protein
VRTDARGDFRLERVPEGEYELTAWLPSWEVARVDHDPNWGVAAFVIFAPPLERGRRVRVRRGRVEQVELEMSAPKR